MKFRNYLPRVIFATLFICCHLLLFAKPPVIVIQQFHKINPGIAKVKWEQEGKNYEAEFMRNGAHCSMVFDALGNMIESEEQIKVSDLPEGVKAYLNKNYEAKVKKEASRITNDAGIVTWEAQVKGKDLIFDGSGKLLQVKTPD